MSDRRVNKIEKRVIISVLEENGCSSSDIPFDDLRVLERHYTGVGVYSEFKPHPSLLIGGNDRIVGGAPTLVINGDILTGYVCYVVNGYFETMEGFTYHSTNDFRPLWPRAVRSVKIG